jgi:hypothetical protein
VEHRVLNPEVPQKEALKCQVCREKVKTQSIQLVSVLNMWLFHFQYHTKNRKFTCIPKGLSKRHWVKVVGLLAFFVLTGLASVYVLVYAHVSSGVKVATVVILVFADAALLKLLGCGLIWLGRRRGVKVGEITNRPTDLPFHGNQLSSSDDVITQTTPTTSSTSGGYEATPTTATGISPNDIIRHNSTSTATGTFPDDIIAQETLTTITGTLSRHATPPICIEGPVASM